MATIVPEGSIRQVPPFGVKKTDGFVAGKNCRRGKHGSNCSDMHGSRNTLGTVTVQCPMER